MKKKILVVSTACLTSINREIYRRFSSDDFDITLLVPTQMRIGDSTINAEPTKNNDPKIIFKSLTNHNPRTMLFHDLNKIIYDVSPNIIILDNDPVSLINFRLTLLKFKFKYKLVNISCENIKYSITKNFFTGNINLAFKSFIKSVSLIYFRRYVDLIFTINKDGEEIYQNFNFNKVVKIPLGINENNFFINYEKRNKIRNQYNINCIVLSFFGRMIYEKGFHLLIEALGELKHFKWKLMIDKFSLYENQYMSRVEMLLNKHSLKDRVIFVDPTHDNISEFMNASDLVIIPSLISETFKEQYCRVAAEALACGKKILSSKSGALPELIGDHGTFFNIDDNSSLTKNLEKLLNFDFENNPYSINSHEYAINFLSVKKQHLIMRSQLMQL